MQKIYWFFTLIFFSAGTFADLTPKVQLLPHQLLPIKYLKEHPEQKGLLINHYMGTGKTFLAFGLGEAFPESQVIIIAPRFLEGHWRKQMGAYGVKSTRRYQFVSYNDAPRVLLKKNLKNTVLLLDECHNLVQLLHSLDSEQAKKYSELFMYLQTSKK